MRHIDKIIWHCAATKEGQDVKTGTIRQWHFDRGWSDIGYHFVIELDGSRHAGRPLSRIGAHVKGLNKPSIGICYVGGVDKNGNPKDTRTAAQKKELYALTEELLARFPGTTVHGHNQFAAKACPSFDAQADWKAYVLSKPIMASASDGDDEELEAA
ncbi:MAG: N-acetylmuramoyl-L-alanine amidase [Pseudomonadota bacterium]